MSNRKKPGEVDKPSISCREAGRRGGAKTAATHGTEYFQHIGRQGGQALSRLVKAGREAEAEDGRQAEDDGRCDG